MTFLNELLAIYGSLTIGGITYSSKHVVCVLIKQFIVNKWLIGAFKNFVTLLHRHLNLPVHQTSLATYIDVHVQSNCGL